MCCSLTVFAYIDFYSKVQSAWHDKTVIDFDFVIVLLKEYNSQTTMDTCRNMNIKTAHSCRVDYV